MPVSQALAAILAIQPAPCWGFTCRMRYLDRLWLECKLNDLFEGAPLNSQLSFANILASDRLAHRCIDESAITAHQRETPSYSFILLP